MLAHMLPVVDAMRELGGVARSDELVQGVGWHAVLVAVEHDVVVRVRRGVYALPEVDEQLQAAHASCGRLSHLSAAAHWGWSLKSVPSRADVIVPRKRKVRNRPPRVRLWYRDVPATELVEGVTEPVRTVLDCARDLPFDEALCVADSALRSGKVTQREIIDAADLQRGPRSARARAVVRGASIDAANPLESTLRAICAGVPGLLVTPQVVIEETEGTAQVDLADSGLRLAIEAEGFETHGTRAGFDKDCRRYTVLVCAGWLVLRFTWTQVMFESEWVAARLAEAAALQHLRADRHNAA